MKMNKNEVFSIRRDSQMLVDTRKLEGTERFWLKFGHEHDEKWLKS